MGVLLQQHASCLFYQCASNGFKGYCIMDPCGLSACPATCYGTNITASDEQRTLTKATATGMAMGGNGSYVPSAQATSLWAKSTPSPTGNTNNSLKPTSMGIIIGIVLAVLLVLFTCILLLIRFKCKRNRKYSGQASTTNNNPENANSAEKNSLLASLLRALERVIPSALLSKLFSSSTISKMKAGWTKFDHPDSSTPIELTERPIKRNISELTTLSGRCFGHNRCPSNMNMGSHAGPSTLRHNNNDNQMNITVTVDKSKTENATATALNDPWSRRASSPSTSSIGTTYSSNRMSWGDWDLVTRGNERLANARRDRANSNASNGSHKSDKTTASSTVFSPAMAPPPIVVTSPSSPPKS